MTRRSKRTISGGWTLMELLVVSAILGIFIVPAVRFIQTMLHSLYRDNLLTDTHETLRQANAVLTDDLNKAVKVATATATNLVIFQDYTYHPNYIKTGIDPFLFPNGISPDLDGDGTVVPRNLHPGAGPLTGECCVGNNLDDDDDDNDGKIDVRVRFWFEDSGGERRLYRQVSYNESPWGPATLLADKLDPASSSFTYYGAMAYMENFPPANPVVPIAAGDGAGNVSGTEISNKIGNGGVEFDIQREKNWIAIIEVKLKKNLQRPKLIDPKIKTVFTPPMLPLKKKIEWPGP